MLFDTHWAVSNPSSSTPYSSYLRIGGVTFGLAASSVNLATLRSELEPFACEPCEPDIEIEVEWEDHFDRSPETKIFDSGAVWTLFSHGQGFTFDCEASLLGEDPYKRMYLSADCASARVVLNRSLLADNYGSCALDYPTDELLITNYLCHHGLGVEVHGCGIIDAETGGHLFLGHSGAGKSTTTRLWETFANPEILSDDRIILRLHDGELWMYGTPWHGEAEFASPARAKLNRIFILQHGQRNAMTRLSPAKSVGEVFARCFPPFHSAVGLERTLEFLSRALAVVPGYDFEFVQDRSAVETVLNFHD